MSNEDRILEDVPDRMVVTLDPGGPIEIGELTQSFSGLVRYYERHYRPVTPKQPFPKLFITRLNNGSVIAEIVPYAQILSGLFATADTSVVIGDFVHRLWSGIKAFCDLDVIKNEEYQPTKQDAADILAFIKPLIGRIDGSCGLEHARYEKRDGHRKTVIEYRFNQNAINKTAVNIDRALAGDIQLLADNSYHAPNLEEESLLEVVGTQHTQTQLQPFQKEVVILFEQASRKPGKDKGRTVDKGVISEISDKPLPVYFRKSFQDLKEKMIRGEVNPLNNAFVVDVHVAMNEDGEPKLYTITEVHSIMPIDRGPQA